MSLPYLHPFLGLSNGLNTLHAVGGGAGGVGGWVELGRTTLGSAGDTITVSSLADKRYYMVLAHQINSGQIASVGRFNNDSGSNYSARTGEDGGADWTNTSRSDFLGFRPLSAITYPFFTMGYFANYASKEKLTQTWGIGQNTAGAGTAPTRHEMVGKWANTSNAINRLDVVNLGSGDIASGSEVVVLGWDPADTHTNNFWQELDSVTQGSSASTFNSNTFSAKKYLWIQGWFEMSAGNPQLKFNSDTASNYAQRSSINGSESSFAGIGFINIFGDFVTTGKMFFNAFIINNSSNEKLVIGHNVWQNTAGAGTAPSRVEAVGKWANTSNQITSIQFGTNTGNINSGSFFKVWGSN